MISDSGVAGRRFVADTFFWRGMTIAAAGACAVMWPERVLVFALVAVAVVAIAFGVVDLATALWLRRAVGWRVPVTLGTAGIAFGALTLAMASVALSIAIVLGAVWLAATGVLALMVGRALRRSAMPAMVPLLFGVLSLLGALALVAGARVTILPVLYAGAGYATLLGMLEVGAAAWLRRHAAW